MAMTAAATVLEHDDLPPDGEPSFADVVYLLTTPPPDADPKNPWDLGSRVCSYVTLFAYSLAHPKQFALWANDAYRIGETIEDATYPEVRRDFVLAAKAKLEYAFSVTKLFLFAPRGPEARARAMAMRPLPVRSPPENGIVRIKWYPNLEATKRWPTGIGKLWVDVPVDHHGSVDLQFVMDLWGMQNCYVIDANRTRPQLWQHPVEKLSALAINVLLGDGHKVIGVVERPSEHLQVAREYRAHLKRQVRLFLTAVPRVLWQTLTPPATVALNLAVYGPRFLWFFVCSLPYILFHALEIVFLIVSAFGTVVVNDLEDLGCAVQDCLTPHVCAVFGAAGAWLIAGFEAAFLTDEEIRRCMVQGEGSRRLKRRRCEK